MTVETFSIALRPYPAGADGRFSHVRRLTALLLFTLGYALMALLAPSVAAVPALAFFATAALVLVTQPAPPRDAAEAVANELLSSR